MRIEGTPVGMASCLTSHPGAKYKHHQSAAVMVANR